MILKIQIMYFQELFTESKKLAGLSFGVVAKLAHTPKFSKILYISGFLSKIEQKPLNLAPNNLWNPYFGQVLAFYEFSKRYLGILPIF